eukprot:2753477-Pyramimonas_sp.AAC.1
MPNHARVGHEVDDHAFLALLRKLPDPHLGAAIPRPLAQLELGRATDQLDDNVATFLALATI